MVLYRFHGRPSVRLAVTGPAEPVGQTLVTGYLPDGDEYIVLAAKTDAGLPATLRAGR